MAQIVRIKDLVRRPPEQGRIKYGMKVQRNGKTFPQSIDRWRFTSPDRDSIEALAEAYGGECAPWFEEKASPQHQFDLVTESSRISVWMPEASLNQTYERWGGRGCERRCDGETCTFYGAGRPMEGPCACADEAEQTCKPYSRFNVVMPQCSFGGVWRLEAKGWHFAHEAPGMIDAIARLQQGNAMIKVDIMLTKRQGRLPNGKPSHFVVPQLIMPVTPQQMVDGLANVGRQAALGPGAAVDHPSVRRPRLTAVPDHDDVVDAEVMEDEWTDWSGDGGQRWGAVRAGDTDANGTGSSDELTQQLEASLKLVREQKAAKVKPTEPEGWDQRPPNIKVRRNPDPNGPMWIRR